MTMPATAPLLTPVCTTTGVVVTVEVAIVEDVWELVLLVDVLDTHELVDQWPCEELLLSSSESLSLRTIISA